MELKFLNKSAGYKRVGTNLVVRFQTNPIYWLGVHSYRMKGEMPGLDPNDRLVDYNCISLELTLLGFIVTFSFALLGKGHKFRKDLE